MNNPIRFIDPDGRSVDNTIVTNEEGTKQFTILDDRPDAIAIFSDEEFNKRFPFYRHGVSTQYNTNVDELRGNAKWLYPVDGMIKLEKFALTQKSDFTNEWYLDKTGKRITNLLPEESAPLVPKSGTNEVVVDFKHPFASKYSPRASNSSGGFYHHIHIHTNGYRPDIAKIDGTGGVISNDPNFGGDITSPPSGKDWDTVIECPGRNAANNAYNVIVSPGHIHLYNHLPGKNKHHIIINRSNLSKENQR
jgi:hypothetical protein